LVFSFDTSFDIFGEGTRGRYKCDCERSLNVGFNGTVTSQTVPAKILATQLLERLETKEGTEIGQEWHLLPSGNGTIPPENTQLKAANIPPQRYTQNVLYVFHRCALSRPTAPQLLMNAGKLEDSPFASSEASLFLFGKVAYSGQQNYNLTYEIGAYHSDNYACYYLSRCESVYSGRNLPAFWRNMYPLPSV
jgi:hypothetical protein